MADIFPSKRLQDAVPVLYGSDRESRGEGDGMDMENRLRAAETDILRLMGSQAKHEEVCALRYEIIKKGNDQIAGYIKWLAISVGTLALVVLGVATVNDLIRSTAARVGMTVQTAPAAPQPHPR